MQLSDTALYNSVTPDDMTWDDRLAKPHLSCLSVCCSDASL